MSHVSLARAEAPAATDEDDVFKALADPSRRLLLDSLFVADGQTLGGLSARLPGMTRFGVMKHLRLLESAGLVVTRKVGREKLHYLNPVPIRLIHDRWIGKYAEMWVAALSDLKSHLEGASMDAPRHVFQVYIRTSPEQLWQAITDPEFTRRFFFETRVDSRWEPGERLAYSRKDGSLVVEGEVLEVERPRRLVTTWAFRNNPELQDDPPSRVTWEIEPLGSTCRLTLVHDFASETASYRSVVRGWPRVLSSLKTLLETGEPLTIDDA
ncbi:MAG: SRPBCC domain-containing protein [Chloroflexi bacterium]|nr:SRPBCC domain-containing protein [Chloroflexota bacterium]